MSSVSLELLISHREFVASQLLIVLHSQLGYIYLMHVCRTDTDLRLGMSGTSHCRPIVPIYCTLGQDRTVYSVCMSGVSHCCPRVPTVHLDRGTVYMHSVGIVHCYPSIILSLWATSHTLGGVSEHETLGNVECYDPETDRWVVDVIPQMRYRRSGVGVAVLQGLLFAIGGYLEGKTSTDAVECYNPRIKRYSAVCVVSEQVLLSQCPMHGNYQGSMKN